MMQLNALLMQLGPGARSERRRELFETVIPDLHRVGVIPLDQAVGPVELARERLRAEMMRLERDVVAGANAARS